MFELETLLPDIMDWLTTSSITEWPALALTVLTAILSKATGGFYRIREAKTDAPEDADYIKHREIDNLIIVGVITLLTQILAFKPTMVLVKRMLPKLVHPETGQLDKNIDALIRMVLFAPGLFISEKLSRVWAGQKRHDELVKFNHKITQNWQRLINTSQGQPLVSLAYNAQNQAGSGFVVTPLPKPYTPVNLPVVTPSPVIPQDKPHQWVSSAPEYAAHDTVIPAEVVNRVKPVTAVEAAVADPVMQSLKSGLSAVPSPVAFQPQSNAMALALKTF